MRWEFYPKLAFEGMRKNRRLYIPYLLTGAGMVAMFYILTFLSEEGRISLPRGGETMRFVLSLGTWVVAFFSVLFLFYTNAFLMRRRKREFGLYNILGMGKGNLGVVLFWENIFVAAFSFVVGLITGIALSKLAELGMVRLLQGQTSFDFSISITGLCHTVAVFTPIFLLLYLNGLRQLRFSTALALLRSENAGEKPPKGNWFLGLLGVALLGTAYCIAVTIGDPVSAMLLFFVAVILVITATYLLMIAGSVLLCRILQKNKRYYYKPNHFVSISSMVYRMKRNGAGLASICILATMVLVMLSSTTALYFGGEGALIARYPREINLMLYFPNTEVMTREKVDAIREDLVGTVWRNGAEPRNCMDYRSLSFAGVLRDGAIEPAVRMDGMDISNVVQVHIFSLSDYNAMYGQQTTLSEGEALVSAYRIPFTSDSISFAGGPSFRVQTQVEEIFSDSLAAADVLPTLSVVVPDFDETAAGLEGSLEQFNLRWAYNFDTGLDETAEYELFQNLINKIAEISESTDGGIGASFERRNAERDDFYGTYGGFLYLGILLSIVFLFATVLIIYYKQISEGYEDQSRFEIMQKVGMTKREIRRSVNSQLLTVFFLPLVGAGLHMAFAFPMLRKLLLLFNLNNVRLFAATTGISFLVFAFFYLLVYRGTSNVYYKIVSGARETDREYA